MRCGRRSGWVLRLRAASTAIAKGDAEIGLFNISEIVPVKGVTLVGPLPAEYQNYIVFAGALHSRGGASPEPAAAYLRSLMEPALAAGKPVVWRSMAPGHDRGARLNPVRLCTFRPLGLPGRLAMPRTSTRHGD